MDGLQPKAFIAEFLSTPSARRATFPEPRRGYRQRYFYPRPPRGGRRYPSLMARIRSEISIHALREEGDTPPVGGRAAAKISIHALREEGDRDGSNHCSGGLISIHALREEGDT